MLVDTLKSQRRLVEEYGLDERAAEGIVEIISDAENQIATKDDLALLRKDFDGLRTEFDKLRTEFDSLRNEFDTLEERLDARIDALGERIDARIRRPEVRLYGVIFAATTLLAALNFFTG